MKTISITNKWVALVLSLLLLIINQTYAQNSYYSIAAGSWNSNIWSTVSQTGANCSCNPGTSLAGSNVAYIYNNVTATTLTSQGGSAKLVVEAGNTLTITTSTYSLSGSGTITVNAGGTLVINGALNMAGGTSFTNNGTVTINGSVTNSGSATVTNNATMYIYGNVTTSDSASFAGSGSTYTTGTVSGPNTSSISAMPPSGAAGGDLSGTYPNPTVSKMNGNTVPANAIGLLQNDGSGNLSWVNNSSSSPWMVTGNNITYNTGYVGIGGTPNYPLEVYGNMVSTGNIFGVNVVAQNNISAGNFRIVNGLVVGVSDSIVSQSINGLQLCNAQQINLNAPTVQVQNTLSTQTTSTQILNVQGTVPGAGININGNAGTITSPSGNVGFGNNNMSTTGTINTDNANVSGTLKVSRLQLDTIDPMDSVLVIGDPLKITLHPHALSSNFSGYQNYSFTGSISDCQVSVGIGTQVPDATLTLGGDLASLSKPYQLSIQNTTGTSGCTYNTPDVFTVGNNGNTTITGGSMYVNGSSSNYYLNGQSLTSLLTSAGPWQVSGNSINYPPVPITSKGYVGIDVQGPAQTILQMYAAEFATYFDDVVGGINGSGRGADKYMGFNLYRDNTSGLWNAADAGGLNGGSVVVGDAAGDILFSTLKSTGGFGQNASDATILQNTGLFVQGGGGVGIGTTTPAAALDVNSSTEQSAIFRNGNSFIFTAANLPVYGYNPITQASDNGIFWSDNQGTGGVGQNKSSGFVIAPWQNQSAGIRIDAPTGNVTVLAQSPSSGFTIGSVAGSADLGYGTSYLGFNISRNQVGGTWHNQYAAGNVIYADIAGDLRFVTVVNKSGAAQKLYDKDIYNNSSMLLTYTGQLGIGTQNPDASLTITAPNGVVPASPYLWNNSLSIYDPYYTHANIFWIDRVGNTFIPNGKLGIGIASSDMPAGYRLYVKDGIITEHLKIAPDGSSNWSDYVFADSYKLPTLDSVKKFISQNHHLQDVPSASEVAKNGIDVGQMDATMLKKIEELTLYIIQQQQQMKEMQAKLDALNKTTK